MLVVISDTHLSDGTTGRMVGASAFRDFRDRLTEVAIDASWRADGSYRPITNYDLLLLGDIFDLIRSTRWSSEQGATRPWDLPDSNHFYQKVDEITQAIIDENAEALSILKGLRDQPIRIPPALNGEANFDVDSAEMIPVPACTHYMVGNHDWFYHLHDPKWPQFDALRQKVSDAMGLFNPTDQPFPFDPETDAYPELQQTLLKHKVVARHGDIFDPFNYHADRGRDASSLGDAMVVELFNEFPHRLRSRAAGAFPEEFLDGVDRLVNVRPSLFVPVWIDSLIQQYEVDYYRSEIVKELWDGLARKFLDSDYVKSHNSWALNDQYDATRRLLRFADGLSFRQVAKVAGLVKRVTKGSHDSYASHALKEKWIDSGQANYVVYGHTHHAETVPLGCAPGSQGTVDQLYFNSGTWMPVYEPTVRRGAGRRFVSFSVMTYIAFFADDERSGRPFETWTGVLANRNRPKPPSSSAQSTTRTSQII